MHMDTAKSPMKRVIVSSFINFYVTVKSCSDTSNIDLDVLQVLL